MKYAIGIGITNRCNYNCPHCYSMKSDSKLFDLPIERIKYVIENLRISSINLGTGETGLHPYFREIIRYFHDNEMKVGLTTNGHTTSLLSDYEVQYFNDIDFSLDFPDRHRHNHFRGKDAYENVINSIKRCKDLGIEASIVTTLMNINYNLMDEMVELAAEQSVNLRVNVYKPTHSRLFSCTYKQFWEGIRKLFKNTTLISCSEPIVNVALAMSQITPQMIGYPCGNKSFRIKPDGSIVPCVYWPYGIGTIENLRIVQQTWTKPKVLNNRIATIEDPRKGDFMLRDDTIRHGPDRCKSCDFFDICRGGCAARRLLNGDVNAPDEFCPIIREEVSLDLDIRWNKEHTDLVHSNYLCTIIVRGD